jgi:hypothetical protein
MLGRLAAIVQAVAEGVLRALDVPANAPHVEAAPVVETPASPKVSVLSARITGLDGWPPDKAAFLLQQAVEEALLEYMGRRTLQVNYVRLGETLPGWSDEALAMARDRPMIACTGVQIT